MHIKLEAINAAETRVLRYLQENASAVLAEKINAGSKTLEDALEYAKKEAKRLATGDVSCVCVDDDTVFGWIVHFFEEDHVGHVAPKKRAVLPASMQAKPAKHAAKRAAPVKEESGQLTMFDTLFAGGAA